MSHPHQTLHPSRYITNKAEGEKRQAFIDRMAQALLKAEREGQKIVRVEDQVKLNHTGPLYVLDTTIEVG